MRHPSIALRSDSIVLQLYYCVDSLRFLILSLSVLIVILTPKGPRITLTVSSVFNSNA